MGVADLSFLWAAVQKRDQDLNLTSVTMVTWLHVHNWVRSNFNCLNSLHVHVSPLRYCLPHPITPFALHPSHSPPLPTPSPHLPLAQLPQILRHGRMPVVKHLCHIGSPVHQRASGLHPQDPQIFQNANLGFVGMVYRDAVRGAQ